ncbi:hypothetical protein [Caulobacter phage Cr30]|nr:hypothetical protein OZ74_gp026 [Caulobacter phage Cr30]AGS80911.1 hypothetical protein [Caulobacter phage Cr30]
MKSDYEKAFQEFEILYDKTDNTFEETERLRELAKFLNECEEVLYANL